MPTILTKFENVIGVMFKLSKSWDTICMFKNIFSYVFTTLIDVVHGLITSQ
jgi:phage-related protein